MENSRLFDVIDTLYKDYISVWEDVCNIESPTSYKAGVDAVGQYFADMALQKGWKVEIFEQEVSGDVVSITLNPDVSAPPVTLSGHIDTVHPLASFGSPAARVDGERIYGPGTCDCKGGVVAGFMAMDALERCGFDSRPVRLILQSDEEVGSEQSGKATINHICESSRDSVAFLNLEGHTRGEACLIRKGIATFEFTVCGHEAHSSRCAEEGANAIAEAAHKIIELEKLKEPLGITCNCGVISGGSVPNTVPALCCFKANFRFATHEQLDYILDYVERVAKTTHVEGCTCKVEQVSSRLPMQYTQKNAELLEKMNAIFDACGLPILRAARRSGGSDAAEVTSFGIPCVDSIGVTGDAIHSPCESAELVSLLESARRIAAVAYYI